MRGLSTCLSEVVRSNSNATARRAEHTIRSVMDQSDDQVDGERYSFGFEGPYAAIMAPRCNGKEFYPRSTDEKCVIGLIPQMLCLEDSEATSWTVRAVEDDLDASHGKGGWSKDRVAMAISTVSKLIRTCAGQLDENERADKDDPRFNFVQNDMRVQVGRFSWNPIGYRPWGIILSRSNDNNLSDPTKKEEVNPFQQNQVSRVICGSERTIGYTMRDHSPIYWAKDSRNSKTSFLKEILNSEQAAIKNTDLSGLTLSSAEYEDGGRKVRSDDTYKFQFVPVGTMLQPNIRSFEKFDNRSTEKDDEDRFIRTFNTTMGKLSVLSADRCSDIDISYNTVDDLSVKIIDDMQKGHQRFTITLQDQSNKQVIGGCGQVTSL